MQLQKAEAKILLRYMVAMASADSELHPEEISVISEVFKKLAEKSLDRALLQDMFEISRNNRFAILDDDSVAAKCSPDFKKLIVKACYLVQISDRVVAANEIDMMTTIAARLKISDSELIELIREAHSK